MPSGTSAEEQKAERNDELVGAAPRARGRDAGGRRQRGDRHRCGAGAQRIGDRRARNGAASDPDRTEHDAFVRQSRPRRTRATTRRRPCSRSSSRWPTCRAARRSSSFRKGCRSRRRSRPSSTTSSTPPTARTSPLTRLTPRACAPRALLANARKEMDSFAEDRHEPGRDRAATAPTSRLTMAFERVEDTLKLDSRTGLARLAEDTGGFLVEQSNDLSLGVPAHRRGQPVPLPADVLAEEHRVRRQVPRDPGEGRIVRARRSSRARAIARSRTAPSDRRRQLRDARRSRCSIARRCRTRSPSTPPASASPIPRARA